MHHELGEQQPGGCRVEDRVAIGFERHGALQQLVAVERPIEVLDEAPLLRVVERVVDLLFERGGASLWEPRFMRLLLLPR